MVAAEYSDVCMLQPYRQYATYQVSGARCASLWLTMAAARATIARATQATVGHRLGIGDYEVGMVEEIGPIGSTHRSTS
eukprot:3005605-Amphidinium_carterae.1